MEGCETTNFAYGANKLLINPPFLGTKWVHFYTNNYQHRTSHLKSIFTYISSSMQMLGVSFSQLYKPHHFCDFSYISTSFKNLIQMGYLRATINFMINRTGISVFNIILMSTEVSMVITCKIHKLGLPTILTKTFYNVVGNGF